MAEGTARPDRPAALEPHLGRRGGPRRHPRLDRRAGDRRDRLAVRRGRPRTAAATRSARPTTSSSSRASGLGAIVAEAQDHHPADVPARRPDPGRRGLARPAGERGAVPAGRCPAGRLAHDRAWSSRPRPSGPVSRGSPMPTAGRPTTRRSRPRSTGRCGGRTTSRTRRPGSPSAGARPRSDGGPGPIAIRGAVLREGGDAARIEPLTLAAPRAGEVRVRILGSGVCHSDLHVRDGDWPRPVPVVMGHEGAGVIEAVGPGVTDRHVGQPVALAWLDPVRGLPRLPGGPAVGVPGLALVPPPDARRGDGRARRRRAGRS